MEYRVFPLNPYSILPDLASYVDIYMTYAVGPLNVISSDEGARNP
jgi:hypothetical protein